MVAYRQTLAKPVELETRYIKQTGGRGKYAVINMSTSRSTKEQIEEMHGQAREEKARSRTRTTSTSIDEIVGGVVPKEYIPSVEDGFRDRHCQGDEVRLPVRRSQGDAARRQVPRRGLVAGRVQARPAGRASATPKCEAGITLLEPIMNVVVICPGDVTRAHLAGDINRRRGEILEMSNDKGRCDDAAQIPLAKLFGYTSDLRNATSGTATFTMEPSHYAPVKEELADLPPSATEKK